MTTEEINTLKEAFREVVAEEVARLVEGIDTFHEEVQYKFDIVFDELNLIRESLDTLAKINPAARN